MKKSNYPAVYVQTNEADGNQVIAFRREPDGSLSELGAYATGGRGDGMPHLTSQGSVLLTGDGSHLLVTNAGSGDLSVFAVGDDGIALIETVGTGSAPKSVAEHDGVLYVLNTGEPSLVGFRLERSPADRRVRARRGLGSRPGRFRARRIEARGDRSRPGCDRAVPGRRGGAPR